MSGLAWSLTTNVFALNLAMDRLDKVIKKVGEFRDARDWSKFHNSKDMAIAISLEASELLEIFLWQSTEKLEGRVIEKRDQIEDEIADIAIYLTELADNLGIDLIEAMEKKLAKNAEKYPVEKARGSSKKYTEYRDDSREKE